MNVSKINSSRQFVRHTPSLPLTDLQTLLGNLKFELFGHDQPAQRVIGVGVVAEDSAVRLRVVEGDEGSHAFVKGFPSSSFFRLSSQLRCDLDAVITMVGW